jgi:hypothetical protein
MPVDTKSQMDIVWIIWDMFLKESEKRQPITKKIINALLTLYSLKYTCCCFKKKRNLVYFAVSLLCENINYEEEIIRESQKTVVSNVLKKIDLVYKQIKKNEVSPDMDYLFKNVKSSNLEKTIEKLETMNTFGENFMPRI